MEHFLEMKGVYQYYRCNALEPGRPAILFLHGLGESGLCFYGALQRPKLQGYNLVIPDLLGCGKSHCDSNNPVDFSFDAHLLRLWQLVESLDLREITLVGHSMGGDLGTLMCEQNRDGRIRRFLNLEGNLCRSDMFLSSNAAQFEEMGLLDNWLRDVLKEDIVAKGVGASRSLRSYHASLSLANADAFRCNAVEMNRLNQPTPDGATELGRRFLNLDLPKIFCWGEQSLHASTRVLLEQTQPPNLRFNRAGHWVMLDRPRAFYEFLDGFAEGTQLKPGFYTEFCEQMVRLRLADIVSEDAASTQPRHCYQPYIRQVAVQATDAKLAAVREKARTGALEDDDYLAMNELLEECKAAIGADTFAGFQNVNALAMSLAQILFVNDCVAEGMPVVIDPGSREQVVAGLLAYMRETAGEARTQHGFFAELFLYQVTFDQLFLLVGDALVLDPVSGRYQTSPRYAQSTGYLFLANKKVLTASDAQKALCYNITTGWGNGPNGHIDQHTWQQLNDDYYSTTSSNPKLFTRYYDDRLEAMLPQFDVAKFRLARTIVADFADSSQTVSVLEVGSGSGSFAADLYKACQEVGRDPLQFKYKGIEPSASMRAGFEANFKKKTGENKPQLWLSQEGGIESVTADITELTQGSDIHVVVFSFSPHHCHRDSLEAFLTSMEVKQRVAAIYFLDGTKEHGWTKPYYMWVDCESPEDFENVTARGNWEEVASWTEPEALFHGHALTNAWCCMRKLI